MVDEIKDQLLLLIDEFGDAAVLKIAEKFERIHRGNSIHIIREWREYLDKATISKKIKEVKK
jgi:hypothetical protein